MSSYIESGTSPTLGQVMVQALQRSLYTETKHINDIINTVTEIFLK